MLRDIRKGDKQVTAARDIIARAAPDILVVAGIDFDLELHAAKAFSETLPHPYPYIFSQRPNSGRATSLDLNGDGKFNGPADAQGFGYFSGDGGLAVFSRHPFDLPHFRDMSALLWKDLPDAKLPRDANGNPFPSQAAQAAQRLSSTNHWALPVVVNGTRITFLISQASPPVFDGPEDMNGLRNRDENRLWLLFLNGQLGTKPPKPFVLVAGTNLDPNDGDGHRRVMQQILQHPHLQDPAPRSEGAKEAADSHHKGDPALDTADWAGPTPGNLRVDYILPSIDIKIRASGVFWPASTSTESALAHRASRHRLVWVDLELTTHP